VRELLIVYLYLKSYNFANSLCLLYLSANKKLSEGWYMMDLYIYYYITVSSLIIIGLVDVALSAHRSMSRCLGQNAPCCSGKYAPGGVFPATAVMYSLISVKPTLYISHFLQYAKQL